MKVHYFIILFLTSVLAQAQMFVSPNSYVYVNDQIVFVTQGVNLNATTSNIYLRKDGQLMQGTAGASTNVGPGALSVYQEGSVNNFQYNYWCSPVGASNATAGNSNFAITQLGIPSTNLDTRSYTAATILPVTNFDGVSANGAVSIAPYWIWKYIQRSAYDPGGPNGWISVRDNPTLVAGEGFTMKGTSGSDAFTPFVGSGANNTGSAQRYDFRGKPNDGTITTAVDLNKFSLIGNPYPSAIDLNAFLLDAGNAAAINGTAYFWQQAVTGNHTVASYQGGYGKYTIALGFVPADIFSYNPDGSYNVDTTINGAAKLVRFTPVGQGFMVFGSALSTVSMKNTFRRYVKEGNANNSDFVRLASASRNTVYDPNSEFYPEILNNQGIDYTQIRKAYAPQIRINARINNTGIIHTSLGFGNNYTSGFDYSADARATSDGTPAGFYFILDNQPHEFAMSADKFDIDKTHALGLRSTDQSNFKIKVGELLWGFDANQAIYMHDKLTDVYTDIKNGEFDITLPAGDVRNRFEITFKNGALSTNNVNINDNFSVFQNNTNAVLTIKNPTGMALQSCSLYDISGKTIFTKNNLASESSYEYSTSGLSEGIYIVKLITTANQEIVNKIAISNKK